MNYYPVHIGDYLSATRHLSWAEDMAYRRLLDTYYTTETPLPTDLRACCRLVLATTDEQREAVRIVLDEFFTLTNDGWVNDRAEAEIERMSSKREKARESALAGVRARNAKTNAQIRSERLTAARTKGNHTKDEWARMIDACGHSCVKCGATGVHLDKDHIVPLYQGGSDGIENLQPLCAPCNAGKGADATDHRPESVRLAFAKSESANAKNPSANGELPTPTPTPTPIKHPPNGGEAASPPARPKRPTILPADFYPDETGVRYAEERGVSIAIELTGMRNWAESKRVVRASWQATWRTWCDKAVEFGRVGGQVVPMSDRSRKKQEFWDQIYGKQQDNSVRTVVVGTAVRVD